MLHALQGERFCGVLALLTTLDSGRLARESTMMKEFP
jgi:hypothetical protein